MIGCRSRYPGRLQRTATELQHAGQMTNTRLWTLLSRLPVLTTSLTLIHLVAIAFRHRDT